MTFPTSGGTIAPAPQTNGYEQTLTPGIQFFLEGVLKLPIRLKRDNAHPATSDAFTVYITQDDIETEYAVYELERQTIVNYPNTRLNVRVRREFSEVESLSG